MRISRRVSSRSCKWLVVLVASTFVLGAGGVGAQVPSSNGPSSSASNPGGGKQLRYSRLSSRLNLLSEPAIASTSASARAARLSVPAEGPGSIRHDEAGRVLVEIRVDNTTPGRLEALGAAGAQVTHVSEAMRTVTALVPLDDLVAVGHVGGVGYMEEVLTPLVGGAAAPVSSNSVQTSAACVPTISEGDTQLRAAEARSLFGVNGAGITVGVMSDSYDVMSTDATNAVNDVMSGDLPGHGNPCGFPTPVNVLREITTVANGSDEGRAMAQIVHDLAPGSPLQFATAFDGLTSFADNIRALQVAGSKVIADDISYFVEPFFQDGPVSVAVNDVTAAGTTYFSSAANSNIILGGNDVASYEAPAFRPSGSCPAGVPAYALQCHDFNPRGGTDNAYSMTVPPSGNLALNLQWAEPWNGVVTDYDIYILSSTNTVLASSEGENVTSQRPFEFVSWTNSTASSQAVQVAINRYVDVGGGGTATPRLKFIHNRSNLSSVEYPVSDREDVVGPSIFGHNGTQNAGSTAAVPYNNSSSPETYSSRGPVTLYFGPVSGTTPAAPLPSPSVIASPDFAATDGVRNTFFGGVGAGGFHRFYGTSASAPHAAAVAALMLNKTPSTPPLRVLGLLANTANVVPSGSTVSVGGGLIDAVAAVGAAVAHAPPPDFDGDGDTDRAAFRDGAWFAEGQPTAFLGVAGDIPVPGDYDGDGDSDRAAYRDGAWFVNGQPTVFLGVAGDIPVPGDYDGNGTVDRAVFRPSVGGWYVDGQAPVFFGLTNDIPVPGDYDGNGTTDRAIFRPSVGGWYVNGQATVFLGLNGDIPVPGDYDANGTSNRGVWRPAVGGWYVEGQATSFLGLNGDVPSPGDYDGNGTTDRGIWRPSVGGWYAQGMPTIFLGLNGDIPLPLPQAIYRKFF